MELGKERERELQIGNLFEWIRTKFLMKILRLNREFLGELRDLATSQVLNNKRGGVIS